MSRGRAFPGTRLFLSLAGAVGLYRAADDTYIETTSSHEAIDPTNRASGDDIHPKTIFFIGIGVLVATWVAILLIYPLFRFFEYDRTGGRDPQKVLQYIPNRPPRPRNVNHPYEYLRDFRANQDAALNGYRWVDRGKGVVAIPIDRAMQLLVERGVPSSKPAAANQYYPPQAASLRTGFEDKVEPIPR